MCFIVQKTRPNAKIATRDIVCYKVVMEDGGRLTPYYYWFTLPSDQYSLRTITYKMNKNNKSIKLTLKKPTFVFNTSLETPKDSKIIYEGYHSYATLFKAKEFCKTAIYSNSIVVRSIIPEGTEYYYNSDREEYVSENIILKEKL